MRRVLPSSAADAAGFRPGDMIVRVGQSAIGEGSPSDTALERTLAAIRTSINAGEPFVATVLRPPGEHLNARSDAGVRGEGASARGQSGGPPGVRAGGSGGVVGKPVELSVRPPTDKPTLGVELSQDAGVPLGRQRLNPMQSAFKATRLVWRELRTIARTLGGALGSLFRIGPSAQKAGAGGDGASLQGPIGIAMMGSSLAATDASRLLEFGAILSLNLAVFNSLPLPGLDGWQLAVLALEVAIRRPLPESAKETANALAGVLFLFAFCKVLPCSVSDMSRAHAQRLARISTPTPHSDRLTRT